MKNASHPNQNIVPTSAPNIQHSQNRPLPKTISNLHSSNTGNYNQIVNNTTKKLGNSHILRGNKYPLSSLPHAKALYDFVSKESG